MRKSEKKKPATTVSLKVYHSDKLMYYMWKFVTEILADGVKLPGDPKLAATAMVEGAEEALRKHVEDPHEFVIPYLYTALAAMPPKIRCGRCAKPKGHSIHSQAYANKVARLTQHT